MNWMTVWPHCHPSCAFLFFRNVATRVVLQLVFGLVVFLPRVIGRCDSGKTRVNKTATPDIPRAQQTPRVASRKRLRMSGGGVEKLVQAPVRVERRSAAREAKVSDFTLLFTQLHCVLFATKTRGQLVHDGDEVKSKFYIILMQNSESFSVSSSLKQKHTGASGSSLKDPRGLLNPRFKMHFHLTSPNSQSSQLRKRNQY